MCTHRDPNAFRKLGRLSSSTTFKYPTTSNPVSSTFGEYSNALRNGHRRTSSCVAGGSGRSCISSVGISTDASTSTCSTCSKRLPSSTCSVISSNLSSTDARSVWVVIFNGLSSARVRPLKMLLRCVQGMCSASRFASCTCSAVNF